MLMYFGNEIKLESDQLSYSLFESNWIDKPKATNVDMIILTEILKQPQELIICKLYPLNLETFRAVSLIYESKSSLRYKMLINFQILKFTYSMFNLLKSFK